MLACKNIPRSVVTALVDEVLQRNSSRSWTSNNRLDWPGGVRSRIIGFLFECEALDWWLRKKLTSPRRLRPEKSNAPISKIVLVELAKGSQEVSPAFRLHCTPVGNEWVQKHMLVRVLSFEFRLMDECAVGDGPKEEAFLQQIRVFDSRFEPLRSALDVDENLVHRQVKEDGFGEFGHAENARTCGGISRLVGLASGFLSGFAVCLSRSTTEG